MKPVFEANFKIKGRFDLTVVHGDGSKSEYPNCANMVVNQGLDAIGGVIPAGMSSLSDMVGGIGVGTSNATPSASDTHLQIFLKNTTTQNGPNTSSAITIAPWSQTQNTFWSFATGSVVGNIAEIAALLNPTGTITSSLPIFSRALIQVGGSPGTITLTATDQLLVTYSLTFIYAAQGSGSITVTTDGTPVSVNWQAQPILLGRSSTINTYSTIPLAPMGLLTSGAVAEGCTNTGFVSVTASPTAAFGLSLSATSAYTAGSFTRTFTYHVTAGAAFSATLYAFAYGFMAWQILFASPIAGTNVQSMDMPIQVTWANAS